jgi:hypothetical protein
MPSRSLLPVVLLLVSAAPAADAPDGRWGAHGHEMIGLVATEALPEQVPAFFREAAAQLSYLNPEPDRWRDRGERGMDPAMDAAHGPEHYINFEIIPDGALLAPSRFAYLDSLASAGIELPGPGLLPWRILEMTQRLRVGFRQWRAAESYEQRAWIEARLLNDAGILGHYVADGSNPHHTTIHHNGWVGENPRGFVNEPRFHSRFESVFVREQITLDDVRGALTAPAQVFPDVREAVWRYLAASHALVEPLYELDHSESFGPDTRSASHRAFASERLAAGAEMLRDLWWTAWVTSG